MAMVPHERSLVQRLQGKPFALLGVNLYSSRDQLKRIEQKHSINWRSWSDGAGGGSISQQWRVEYMPAIYVLDAKGVIRYKDVRETQLDRAVDKLLAEIGK